MNQISHSSDTMLPLFYARLSAVEPLYYNFLKCPAQYLLLFLFFENLFPKNYILLPVQNCFQLNIQDLHNNHICMERPQYAKEEIAFYKEGIKRGFMYQGVKPSNYGVCGAISLNSFVIGPDGALYKCWNDIGYSERSIGNLEKGIKLTNKFVEWLSYDVVKDQECKDCSFFPVCYGGCAAYKNKICSSVKWNAEEMLELMKEMAQ